MAPIPEKAVPYKTGVKIALVEGLRMAFAAHPDPFLRNVKATLDFPRDKSDYPAIIVRFYERSIKSAGIDHEEFIEVNGVIEKHRHYLFDGDVEFSIAALSSLDRDLLADTIVQLLAMGDIEQYTLNFFNRVYTDNYAVYPDSGVVAFTMNTDTFSGYGETQAPTPWESEDELVFSTAYRFGVFGEMTNRPGLVYDYGFLQKVDMYPYAALFGEPVPNPNPSDPAQWQPPT